MQNFINQILPGAKRAHAEYGVLPSLTLSQAILESNSGKSSIGNNIFGIKATSTWKGKKQLVWTTEYIKGVKTKVQAWFRDYDSIDESILDHAKLLTLTRYKPVVAAKDYKEACIQVQKCGYATDPKYATKLINIIEQNKLNLHDVELTEEQLLSAAIDKLSKLSKPIITSPSFYKENAKEGKMIPGEYVAIILKRMADYLG
jgi:flagellum-specific peptidoglycan hydrolase FlgJ